MEIPSAHFQDDIQALSKHFKANGMLFWGIFMFEEVLPLLLRNRTQFWKHSLTLD